MRHMERHLLASLTVWLLSGCDGSVIEAPVDAATEADAQVVPRDLPHWAIVGLRYDGIEAAEPPVAPPAEAMEVPQGQPLVFTAITEAYDYCGGDIEPTSPCCVAGHGPEVFVDGDEIIVIVRVELSLDVPCNGFVGPIEIPVTIEPLPPGLYRLVGLGRDSHARPDIEVQLDVR